MKSASDGLIVEPFRRSPGGNGQRAGGFWWPSNSIAAAVERRAQANKWSNPEDPLVIDLDGDGIELVALADSGAWFDIDGDLFAERTGWVGGDDGLLVLDGNGNGRISAADAIWSALQIWRDRDGDRATDAGELAGLDARRRRAANDNDNEAWREAAFIGLRSESF
jgi:hypothetical protein